jgi:hypothetical protein
MVSDRASVRAWVKSMRDPISYCLSFSSDSSERYLNAARLRAAQRAAKIDARTLLLLASLAVALAALPTHAAANTQPVPPAQISAPAGPGAAHVWTNADIAKLAMENNISLVGPEPVTPSNPAAPSPPPSYSENKARGLAERAAHLHRELHLRKDKLRRYLEGIDSAKSLRETEPGVNFYMGNVGITVDSGREILESKVREVEAELDNLADLARRNDTPPGVLRTNPSLLD